MLTATFSPEFLILVMIASYIAGCLIELAAIRLKRHHPDVRTNHRNPTIGVLLHPAFIARDNWSFIKKFCR